MWFGVVAIVAVCTIYGLQVSVSLALFDNWGDRANFGSSFGAVSALFSGLALVGVIYAVTLQTEELGLQRQELAYTREELRRAATAQEESQKIFAAQMKAITSQNRLSSEIEICRINRELVVLGLQNPKLAHAIETDGEGIEWSPVRSYIQLWINQLFVMWRAFESDLMTQEDWNVRVSDFKSAFGKSPEFKSHVAGIVSFYPSTFATLLRGLLRENE